MSYIPSWSERAARGEALAQWTLYAALAIALATSHYACGWPS